MVRSICMAKRCNQLRKRTEYFPMYKIKYVCGWCNRELKLVAECPLEKLEKEKNNKNNKKQKP